MSDYQTLPRRPPKIKDLGELHNVLTAGLPDWCFTEGPHQGQLNSYELAERLGISYQALYQIYARNRLPAKRISLLIELSEKTKRPKPDFKPLTLVTLSHFIG